MIYNHNRRSVQLTVHVKAEEVPEDEDEPAGQVEDGNAVALDNQVPEHIEGVVVGIAAGSHAIIRSPEPRHDIRHGPQHCGDQGDAQPNLER